MIYQQYLFNIIYLSVVDSEDYYEYPSDITVTVKTTNGLKFVNLSCNMGNYSAFYKEIHMICQM